MRPRDLKSWQEAVSLAGEVLRVMLHTARPETRRASDAAVSTALAIPILIGDAHYQTALSDQRELYRAARKEVRALEAHIAVLHHAGLLGIAVHDDLVKRCHRVSRLLAGYLVYLERQQPQPGATNDDA